MFRSFKTFLLRHRVLLSSLFAVFLYSTVIVIAAPLYNSGDTLDPTCLPSSTDCTVDTGGSGSLSIGDTIGNSPDANGILYVNNAGDLTTDPLFTREDNNTYIAKEIETTAITNMDVVTGTLVYAADVVGAFQVGETITGGTSGATAVIDYIVSENSEDYLYLSNISGPFQALETVTGNTSFATGTYAMAFPAGQFSVSDTFFAFNLDNQQVVGQGTITDITVDGYSVTLSSGTISENDLIFDDLQNITKLDTIRSINATLGPGPTITTSIQSGDSILSDLLPGGYQGTGIFYQDSTRLAGFYAGNDYFGNDFTFNQTAMDLDANVGISIAAGYSDINGDPFYQIYYNDPNNSGFGFFGFSPTAARLEHGEEIRLYAPEIRIGTGDGYGNGYYLPVSDGSADQVLTTDGNGNVTWQDGSGGSSLIGSTNTLGSEAWLGYEAGGNNAASSGTVFSGYYAGYDATYAHYSIFQGYNAGYSATNADNSVFLGQYAGYQATDADYSNFFGQNAGYQATYAFNSNFFGVSAGAYASNAQQSNFFGANAGSNATDANYSNFFGQNAGSGATSAPNSNFFGTNTGGGATNAAYSNFFGYNAGQNATNAARSIFIGYQAGFNDTVDNTISGSSILIGDSTSTGGFSNSIALGATATNTAVNQFLVDDSYTDWSIRGINYVMPAADAAGVLTSDGAGNLTWGAGGSGPISVGTNASTLYSSGLFGTGQGDINFGGNIFLGQNAGNSADNVFYGNFIGFQAGYQATGASGTNFIGNSAGYGASDASSSVFIGNSAGHSATSAGASNFIGHNTGYQATNASVSNFIGYEAGYQAIDAENSNFIGYQSGYQATNAPYSSFIGHQAGYGATNAAYSTFLGYAAGINAVDAYNSIFIGYQAGYADTVFNTYGNDGSSILIGDHTSTGGYSNSIAIGDDAVNTATNQFLIGDSYTDFSFRGVNYVFPAAQAGGVDYILINDGSGNLSWGAQPTGTIPSQTGHAGKFLTTDGTNASWGASPSPIAYANTQSLFSTATGGGTGSNANYSIFFGYNAGYNAVGAGSSVFIGQTAGYGSTSTYSVFLGQDAGRESAVLGGMFIGSQAGYQVTNGDHSTFIGNNAGYQATNSDHAVGIGVNAGNGATNATESVFIGHSMGISATNAVRSIFIGSNPDNTADTVDNTGNATDNSIVIGYKAFTGGFSNSIALGATATNTAVNQFLVDDSYTDWSIRGINYVMPAADGAGVLTSDGSGNLTWGAGGSGPIEEVATGNLFSTGIGAGTGATTTDSIFFGYDAGDSVTNLIRAIYIGYEAGFEASNNDASVFIGNKAGWSASTADASVFIGVETGNQATNSDHSNFIGVYAGYTADSADYSNFIGHFAGYDADTATYGNFFGYQAGYFADGADGSNFIGYNAGYGASLADTANFIGENAGRSATSASNSNFMGYRAGYEATSASYSNFIGAEAGYQASSANTSNFIGYLAGRLATNASYSNFFGFNAGNGATSANNSNFIGEAAGGNATNASLSNFFGFQAGSGATNAKNSIFIGQYAGYSDTVDNTGNADDFSILIGKSTSTGGFENSIAIGGSATNTASNQFMIGSTTRPIDTTIWKGSSSTECTITTGTGIACSSDERLKTNIEDLPSDTLSKLLTLKTVTYNWIQNDNSPTQIGFLAQDLETSFPELVATNSTGFKSVYYAQMTPILVQAIRELNMKVIDISDLTKENDWRDALVSWLGDMENWIGKIFTSEIQTDTLCVGNTCVTESQLQQLLNQQGVTITTTSPPDEDEAPTDTDPVPENPDNTTDETITDIPSEESPSEPEPTPEESDPAPDTTPSE